jgi:hypothetical protein
MLLTSIPAERGGRPQLRSLHLIHALTTLGQRLPVYRRVEISFSNDGAIVGCIPLAKSCHSGLSGPRSSVLGPWLVVSTRFGVCEEGIAASPGYPGDHSRGAVDPYRFVGFRSWIWDLGRGLSRGFSPAYFRIPGGLGGRCGLFFDQF